jgi:midasin (ATPase involved in ribosome maturation)
VQVKRVEGDREGIFKAIVIQGHTMSFFPDGPVVRAMKEGKPLIIDEIDAYPHSTF